MLLWVRTIWDFMSSALTAYVEEIEEVIMVGNRSISPLSWWEVILVVLPGIFFGISRSYYSLGWLSSVSFILVMIFALGWLITKKRLPAWGLLVLGILTGQALMLIGILAREAVGRYYHLDFNTISLILAIPLWIGVIALVWRYRHTWRGLWLALILLAVMMLAESGSAGYSMFSTLGFFLLPLAIGLHVARRHGYHAVLFVAGAYSLWLFDSDYFSGPGLHEMGFYPIYASLLVWIYLCVAPFFFLRAKSKLRQALGLLIPIGLAAIARVAVPLLALGAGIHPARIWSGDTFLSVFGVLMLGLSLGLYWRVGERVIPDVGMDSSQEVYSG
jgi:hypothetical protein